MPSPRKWGAHINRSYSPYSNSVSEHETLIPFTSEDPWVNNAPETPFSEFEFDCDGTDILVSDVAEVDVDVDVVAVVAAVVVERGVDMMRWESWSSDRTRGPFICSKISSNEKRNKNINGLGSCG